MSANRRKVSLIRPSPRKRGSGGPQAKTRGDPPASFCRATRLGVRLAAGALAGEGRKPIRKHKSSAPLPSIQISIFSYTPDSAILRHMPAHPWPHAPTHQLSEHGIYFVTGATYEKTQHFRGRIRLQVLHRGRLTVARDFGWTLEAWAVFSNHYHFAAHSPTTAADAANLSDRLSTLQAKTARWINRLDGEPERKVWFNFWETRLTHQRSALARLN